MSQTYAARAQKDAGTLTVSHPYDPAERQADQAADIVARGGSVAGWSFASVGADGPSIQRDEASPKQPTDADKYKAGAKKAGEALLETKAGKELIQKVEDTEPVRAIKKGLDTTAGQVIAGGVIAAGAGGLAAAKQPLPVQLPEITIAPGVSVGVHVEGQLNNPTSGGITLTFKERGGSGKGPTESDKIANETRRLRASTEMFKSAQQKAQEQADERAVVAAMFARSAQLKPVIPLAPGAKPYIIETPTADKTADDEPKKEAAPPVQREAVSAAPTSLDTSGVESVARDGGRPLDTGVRRSMEVRFGYDFSSVRVHDDAQGHAAADGVQANAFTVGEHIGFAAGRSSLSSPAGRRLLAHELAHVVQHARTPRDMTHRQPSASPATQQVARAERFASWANRLSDDDMKKQEEWITYNLDRGRDPYGWEKLRALRNERSDRDRETAKPVRLRGEDPLRESAQGAGSETPDSIDRRVETVKKTSALLDSASKYSARVSIVSGRYRETFEHIHEFSERWGKVVGQIDRLEEAELAYDLGNSFVKLARTKPDDPEALANNAGEAFNAVGRLMEMTHFSIVSDYGQLLISTSNFFAEMRVKMDRATNMLKRHPEYAPYMTGLGGPE